MTERLHRQCPHCKSKKGFTLYYTIHGNGHEGRDFKGKVIDCEREVFDSNERSVECLNCGKPIQYEKVET